VTLVQSKHVLRDFIMQKPDAKLDFGDPGTIFPAKSI
jgi:hypothetical protein